MFGLIYDLIKRVNTLNKNGYSEREIAQSAYNMTTDLEEPVIDSYICEFFRMAISFKDTGIEEILTEIESGSRIGLQIVTRARKKYFVEDLLLKTLKNTRQGKDILSMEYVIDVYNNEMVIIHFPKNSSMTVNVTADSEWAIMQDVMKAIPYILFRD